MEDIVAKFIMLGCCLKQRLEPGLGKVSALFVDAFYVWAAGEPIDDLYP